MVAGDRTKELLEDLGLQLEDAEERRFTQLIKLGALERAQLRIASLLRDEYLTEFQAVDEDVDASSGVIDLSALNSGKGVLRGAEGIIRVRVKPGGNDDKLEWANELDFKDDVKRTKNSKLAGTDSNPLYYIFNGQITILVTTFDETTANIYYLKIPEALSTSIDPLLNPSLNQILLDMAEASCWKVENEHARSKEARDAALDEIKVLNARYTQAEGIGTKSRRRVE